MVKERIQRIPGVGSVTLVGGREREVRIWVDAKRLRSYGLSVDDVIRALRSEHAEVPGGRLEAGAGASEFAVKTKGEVESVREFGNVVVAFRDGAPTRARRRRAHRGRRRGRAHLRPARRRAGRLARGAAPVGPQHRRGGARDPQAR